MVDGLLGLLATLRPQRAVTGKRKRTHVQYWNLLVRVPLPWPSP